MIGFVYYVYNNVDNCICPLDLLSGTIYPCSGGFDAIGSGNCYFDLHVFRTKFRLFEYLNSRNKQTSERYARYFHIKPPYTVRLEYDQERDMCTTRVFAREYNCAFMAHGGPTGHTEGTEFEKFLANNRGQRFDRNYLYRLHSFLVNSQVIKPLINHTGNVKDLQFMITLADTRKVKAKIDISVGYFLQFEGITNDAIFMTYNLEKRNLQQFLAKPIVQTQYWPEGSLDELFSIIDYINEICYAPLSTKSTLSITNNEITFFGAVLYISQLKSGKWYIKGDVEKIFKMFGVSDCSELRQFVDRVLGKKVRRGVFPECETRDEILELLNKAKKCMD